jgi:tetratricopeptide (TPR) repeat protein
MPPRYTYWTIILDGQPTAFRAADRETLLPTLKQLQSKNPGASLKWFARGKVWDSPEEAGSWGAIAGAAAFYEGVGKYSDEAALYADAAQHARDSHAQYLYLLSGAAAASRGRDFKRAQSLLEQAYAIEPDQPKAYYELVMNVYVPQKDMAGVKHTVAQAIDNGIDSYEMESLLASAAQSMGDLPAAIDAIKKIAADRPDSFEVTMRLGELYGQNHDFNQAVIMLTKAIELRPDSALAYEILAGADEQAYNYADADKAYARAAQLAPDNEAYKMSYAAFLKKSNSAGTAKTGTRTP